MSNYKELKDTLQAEKTTLNKRLDELVGIVNRYKKIKNIINDCVEKNDNNTNQKELNQLKKYFPDLEESLKGLEKMGFYKWIIMNDPFNRFIGSDLVRDVENCAQLYNYPSLSLIEELKNGVLALEEMKLLVANNAKTKRYNLEDILTKKSTKIAEMVVIIDNVYAYLVNQLLKDVVNRIKSIDEESLLKEIEDIKDKLALINQFNPKFSNDKLLTKFASDEEIELFINLLDSLFDDLKCKEILNSILIDQNKEEKRVNVNFDNLDMTKFNDDEIKIIEEIRQIFENEDLNEEDDIFDNQTISYKDRLLAYQKASINHILVDVKKNILNKIYDEKDEVIGIFKGVIDLYNKYTIRIMREDKIKDLLRIKDDFVNIISFINKTYIDKSKAYNETEIINEYINSINHEYLPMLEELSNSGYIDQYYDDEFEAIITKFREIVREYKKQMTLYNITDETKDDVKENTNNLVFCLTDDIDLSQEGFQKEFIGTIEALELKSSQELKMRSGRKGMSKIRKKAETNREEDFTDYLEKRKRVKIHFTPYRYSSGANYRTGLIKFEPSGSVKKFLEERYGLSYQSAYYGVFKIISVIGANHSEYSYLEEYILDNYLEIEKLALLFASDNPDLEKLTSIIDQLLATKHEKINMISSSLRK